MNISHALIKFEKFKIDGIQSDKIMKVNWAND